MQKTILLLLLLITSTFAFSQEKKLAKELPLLEIREGNTGMSALLDKIVNHQQTHFGKTDTLIYELMFAKTPPKLLGKFNEYDHIYITGIDDTWPNPPSSMNNMMGYIQKENICFLFNQGDGFSDDYFSQIFSVKKKGARTFSLNRHKEPNVDEEDDAILRSWCHYLYKNDQFVQVRAPWAFSMPSEEDSAATPTDFYYTIIVDGKPVEAVIVMATDSGFVAVEQEKIIPGTYRIKSESRVGIKKDCYIATTISFVERGKRYNLKLMIPFDFSSDMGKMAVAADSRTGYVPKRIQRKEMHNSRRFYATSISQLHPRYGSYGTFVAIM